MAEPVMAFTPRLAALDAAPVVGAVSAADEYVIGLDFLLCYTYTDRCQSGDPHGENIYDWAYHMAQATGGVLRDFAYTMESSPCIGPPDNVYPFTGGYRTD